MNTGFRYQAKPHLLLYLLINICILLLLFYIQERLKNVATLMVLKKCFNMLLAIEQFNPNNSNCMDSIG